MINEPELETSEAAFNPIPSLITLCNAFCGFASIVYALASYARGEALPEACIWFLLGAMAFDTLDGLAARLLNAKSLHGINLDSLADAISFGVAPAVTIFVFIKRNCPELSTLPTLLIWAVALFYLGCTLWRLARYNTMLADEKKEEDGCFLGLPSPAGASMIYSAGLFLPRLDLGPHLLFSFLLSYAFLTGLLMISRIPYPHVRRCVSGEPRSLSIIFVCVVLGSVAMFGLTAMVIWAYIYFLIAPLAEMLARKRNAPSGVLSKGQEAGEIRGLDQATREYENRFGNVLNTDSAKLLFSDQGYNPTSEESVRQFHPAGTNLTEKLLNQWLKTKRETGDGTVVFLGGGNGSGKSTFSSVDNPHSFVVDSTMASKGAIESDLQKTIDAGYKPVIRFVYRDPLSAWTDGIQSRIETGGHLTPKSVFANSHSTARNNLDALIKKFGDDINVEVFENKTGQDPVQISLDELRSKPQWTKEQIVEAINEHDRTTTEKSEPIPTGRDERFVQRGANIAGEETRPLRGFAERVAQDANRSLEQAKRVIANPENYYDPQN